MAKKRQRQKSDNKGKPAGAFAPLLKLVAGGKCDGFFVSHLNWQAWKDTPEGAGWKRVELPVDGGTVLLKDDHGLHSDYGFETEKDFHAAVRAGRVAVFSPAGALTLWGARVKPEEHGWIVEVSFGGVTMPQRLWCNSGAEADQIVKWLTDAGHPAAWLETYPESGNSWFARRVLRPLAKIGVLRDFYRAQTPRDRQYLNVLVGLWAALPVAGVLFWLGVWAWLLPVNLLALLIVLWWVVLHFLTPRPQAPADEGQK